MLTGILCWTKICFLTIKRGAAFKSHPRVLCQMGKVYLRKPADSQTLDINFRYVDDALKIDRVFNFSRSLAESVEIATSRIQTNLLKQIGKQEQKVKKKIQKQQVPESENGVVAGNDKPREVYFWLNTSPSSPLKNITIDQLLASGCNGLHLHLINESYEVVLNEPWIESLEMPSRLLSGYPVYPYKVELQFGLLAQCKASWYRAKMPASWNVKDLAWEHCGDGLIYTPTSADIGCYLKIVITPRNETNSGPAFEKVSKTAVQLGPVCPFEKRQKHTSKRLEDPREFRVLSYNLLAEMYATTETAAKELFPYCPQDIIDMSYRRPLLLKEIVGYNADILCLQEVDARIFNRHLKPMLMLPEFGAFNGHFAEKGSNQEGVATFFNAARFECLDTFRYEFGENRVELPRFAPIWSKIASNDVLLNRFTGLPTILQVTVLKCKATDRYIIVGNTHLYFHPDSDHIRLLQAGLSCLLLQETCDKTLEKWKIADSSQLSVLFCGDFNSTPDCGVYKLMTENSADEGLLDWRSNEQEAIGDLRLTQPYRMASAYGTPAYTNYTPVFSGCLDYIFFQCDHLDVKQIVPMPSDEEVKAHIAIPSKVFPSDHIALVADLRFKH